MTAPPRLRGLRLHGFKSFAERTSVEFGPGISAVVGPNGSGKSNLADALRWALGEQGRSLRIRRSEDVIWAGSERRAAQGMADVTLLIDNADALLPVEYVEVELGRRLYRSGENDYLLNRQRVRLRDLVDLLDAAHLADNAFLFIGQGMVDQALALRPEERRPLFEEVAGVRRHERRRRRAEEQLAESEANLARVDDILAELRPQARRLATQAEQQATRASAADDLAAAVVAVAHARWHEAAARAVDAAARRARAMGDATAAAAALATAEAAASALASELEAAAEQARERQAAHDAARSALEEVRLRDARIASELGALDRDRERLVGERDAAATESAAQRRALARPVPPRDLEGEAALAEAERALAEALAELGALRTAKRADDEGRAALLRAAAAHEAERETARRRLAEAERRAGEEGARAAEGSERRAELEARLAAARDEARAAAAAEAVEAGTRARAAGDARDAEASRAAAAETAAAAREALATTGARLAALTARMDEEESRAIARAARRHGGRRVDDELTVEPRLAPAVERALGELARGYVVTRTAARAVASEPQRGHLVISEALGDGGPRGDRPPPREPARDADAVVALARDAGGGPLSEAVRRDAAGAAIALLSRTVWLPDLDAALGLQAALPAGWSAVTLDGAALVTREAVALGKPDDGIERRAEAERLRLDVEALGARADAAEAAARDATARAEEARATLAAATAAEARSREDRRAAEDRQRLADRALEQAVREAEWHAAQHERLAAEAERARAALETTADTDDGSGDRDAEPSRRADALAAWEERAAELRSRRDRLAQAVADRDAERRSAEQAQARAEAAAAFAASRAAAADASLLDVDARQRAAREEAAAIAAELAAADGREAQTRADLDARRAADTAIRDRLRAAESAVHAARESLRTADERVRAADVGDLEARLGLDSLRESVLVDLASLGEVGIRHLEALVDDAPAAPSDDDGARLEAALARTAATWSAAAPAVEPPTAARLAALRRRYHELGAGNPYAVEEYAAVKARLESLDGQARDLREAIGRTRRLIDELNAMVASQFAATFRALEAAFDARFRQLFGGGFAKLSLTDPDNLGATGIEIVARPPGKKAAGARRCCRAASVPSPPSPCSSRCSRSGRSRSACSTRSTPRSTRRTSGASPTRSAASPTGSSSSSSPTTAGRSSRPTPSTGSPSGTIRSAA